MRMCSVEGCSNKHESKGLCIKHYQKFRKYGDPLSGKENGRRKGEGTVSKDGYIIMTIKTKRDPIHRSIIEKALGHEIPTGAVSHHVDGNRAHNENSNLVLCDSRAYHMLLHRRRRSSKDCGHAHWRKCGYCKKYDDPVNLYISPKSGNVGHRTCANEYNRKIKSRDE